MDSTETAIYINIGYNYPDWMIYYVNEQGTVAPVTDVTQLASYITENTAIVILVPTDKVSLYTVSLPKLSKTELLKALPFELEDRLAEDIDKIHFAIADKKHQENNIVGVVNQSVMNSWMSSLKKHLSAYLKQIVLLTPESLMLPYQDKQWTLLAKNQKILLRMGENDAIAMTPSNAESIINLLLSSTDVQRPEKIDIYASSPLPLEMCFEKANIKISKHKSDDPWLSLLNADSKNLTTLNLLQGAFSFEQNKSEQVYSPKRVMIVSAACALIISFALGAENIWLNWKEKHLQTQISQVYRSLYPKSKYMLDPKRKIQNELVQIKKGKLSDDFLSYLAQIATILNQVNGVRINMLTYRNQQLTITLSATSFMKFNQFKMKLQSEKFLVTGEKVKRQGEIVQATLELTK